MVETILEPWLLWYLHKISWTPRSNPSMETTLNATYPHEHQNRTLVSKFSKHLQWKPLQIALLHHLTKWESQLRVVYGGYGGYVELQWGLRSYPRNPNSIGNWHSMVETILEPWLLWYLHKISWTPRSNPSMETTLNATYPHEHQNRTLVSKFSKHLQWKPLQIALFHHLTKWESQLRVVYGGYGGYVELQWGLRSYLRNPNSIGNWHPMGETILEPWLLWYLLKISQTGWAFLSITFSNTHWWIR